MKFCKWNIIIVQNAQADGDNGLLNWAQESTVLCMAVAGKSKEHMEESSAGHLQRNKQKPLVGGDDWQ